MAPERHARDGQLAGELACRNPARREREGAEGEEERADTRASEGCQGSAGEDRVAPAAATAKEVDPVAPAGAAATRAAWAGGPTNAGDGADGVSLREKLGGVEAK